MLEGHTAVAFVSVADRERALAFYRDILGFTLRSSDDFGLFIDMGSALIRMTAFPGYEAGPHPVLGWNVPDIHVAAADLTARGVIFTIYEGMGQSADGVWTAPDGVAKVAWFPDSEGNLLSISQA
jgi:catechol 2,3-dioxygenase-like lactoylglutathione lyase family enzyme